MAKRKNGASKSQAQGTKYPLIPLNKIVIVERPKPGEETNKIFYNPRSLESMDPDSMTALRESIQIDGLQQPPLVRSITKGGNVDRYELIAGERRYRSVQWLVKHDVPCYDEDKDAPVKYKAKDWVVYRSRVAQVAKVTGQTYSLKVQCADEMLEFFDVSHKDLSPTTPASKLYANIECKVSHNCDDYRALRLAFTENDKSKPLTVQEEIDLVERLSRTGIKQDRICEIIGQNVTWVSQTANFRTQLPEEAFQKLLQGKLARNVAVTILSYSPEDRQTLYNATKQAEQEATKQAILTAQKRLEQAEDAEDLAVDAKEQAEAVGDASSAAKAAAKAARAAQKTKQERKKKAETEASAGTIRQGHIQRGAAEAGLMPKKARMLPKQDIRDLVKSLEKMIGESPTDPVTGDEVPEENLILMRSMVQAILMGIRDPFVVHRNAMVEAGLWEVSDDGGSDAAEAEDDNDDDDTRLPSEREDYDAYSEYGDDYDSDGPGDDELSMLEEGID